MKVHLIKTIDFRDELYTEIFNFLAEYKSPIEFLKGTTDSKFNIKKKFVSQDAYTICERYREENQILADDIVVVLTSKPGERDWFRGSDPFGNIFVVSQDITESYSQITEGYFCVYEMLCGITHYLLKLDFYEEPQLQKYYIHLLQKQGCLNDSSVDAQGIYLKIKSTDLCPDCYNRSIELGVSSAIIVQILAIADAIRQQTVSCLDLDMKELSGVVYAKKEQKIYLKENGKELTLNNLSKAIYLFFLLNPAGGSLRQLKENHISELSLIYNNLSNRKDSKGTISNLFTKKDAFTKSKGLLNKELTKHIGNPLAKNYHIVNVKTVYQINLPKDKIEFRE